MLFATGLGCVLFGIFQSLITSYFIERITMLRRGRTRITETDHIVILGWTPLIFPIMRELVYAFETRAHSCIAVLGAEDRLIMQEEISTKMPDVKSTQIICRRGNPLDVDDLGIVNIAEASAVILLSPSTENPDSEVIKMILALQNRSGKNRRSIRIVSSFKQIQNFELLNFLRSESNRAPLDQGRSKMVQGSGRGNKSRKTKSDPVEIVNESSLIAKMIAHTCRRKGLAEVYSQLLGFVGSEFYQFAASDYPELIGKPFKECLLAFENACPVGLSQERGGIPLLPPPMELPICSTDKILFVQTNEIQQKLLGKKLKITFQENLISLKPGANPIPETTLMIGWNLKAIEIIKELDMLVAKGTQLTIASRIMPPTDVLEGLEEELKNIRLHSIKGETTDRIFLEGLDLPGSNYKRVIILGYSDSFDIYSCDSQTLVTLLHVRDIVERDRRNMPDMPDTCDKPNRGQEISIVTELLDCRNRNIASRARSDDLIVSNQFVAMLLSQLAYYKDFDLFNVFASERQQIFLKLARNYLDFGEENSNIELTFATVVEAASRKGETAIGYHRVKDCFNPEKYYGVVINPPKSKSITFEKWDRIVVFSDSEVK
jgi:hypothetical protein